MKSLVDRRWKFAGVVGVFCLVLLLLNNSLLDQNSLKVSHLPKALFDIGMFVGFIGIASFAVPTLVAMSRRKTPSQALPNWRLVGMLLSMTVMILSGSLSVLWQIQQPDTWIVPVD